MPLCSMERQFPGWKRPGQCGEWGALAGSPPNSTKRRGYEICAVLFRLEPMPKVSLYKIAHVIQGKTMLQAAGEGHAGGANLTFDGEPRDRRPIALALERTSPRAQGLRLREVRPSLPKFARSRRVRASRFSLELNN